MWNQVEKTFFTRKRPFTKSYENQSNLRRISHFISCFVHPWLLSYPLLWWCNETTAVIDILESRCKNFWYCKCNFLMPLYNIYQITSGIIFLFCRNALFVFASGFHGIIYLIHVQHIQEWIVDNEEKDNKYLWLNDIIFFSLVYNAIRIYLGMSENNVICFSML